MSNLFFHLCHIPRFYVVGRPNWLSSCETGSISRSLLKRLVRLQLSSVLFCLVY